MEPWRHHDVIPLKIFLKSQIFIFWILFFEIRSKTPLTGPPKSENRTFWKNFNFDPQWWRHQWVKIDPNPQNFFIRPKWPHLPSMGSLGPRLRFWEGKVWKNSKIAKNGTKFSKQAEFGRLWCRNGASWVGTDGAKNPHLPIGNSHQVSRAYYKRSRSGSEKSLAPPPWSR